MAITVYHELIKVKSGLKLENPTIAATFQKSINNEKIEIEFTCIRQVSYSFLTGGALEAAAVAKGWAETVDGAGLRWFCGKR